MELEIEDKHCILKNNTTEVNYLESNKDKLNTNFVMEVNMIEVPLCKYKNKRRLTTARDLLNDEKISDLAKDILRGIPENSKDSQQVDIFSWNNSKGEEKEILAISTRNLPSSFDMEVFHALVGLYMKKTSPISYKFDINNRKILDIPEIVKVEFKLVELCEYMNLKRNGSNYKRIKDAIRNLNAVNYYSLRSGVFYDKKCNDYAITSREKSISLIDSYDLFSKKVKEINSKATDVCWIKFGDLVTENLRYNYIRFLNQCTYFCLSSGLTRRLYAYISSNKYHMDYLKRHFDTLAYKIPIDFKYPSELKRKLKKPLEELIRFEIIKDFWWGDELLINGIKEHCLYVAFKKDRVKIIQEIEDKTKKQPKNNIANKSSIKDTYALNYPTDIKNELLDLGVNEKAIEEMLNRFSGKKQYELVEYILWVKSRMHEGNVDNPPGLLKYAITPSSISNTNFVIVAKTHPHITEFVNKYRLEIEGEENISKKELDKEFEKYIDRELKTYKKEDPEFYEKYVVNEILDTFEAVYLDKIKKQKQLYNMTTNHEEQEKILQTIKVWEDYPRLKEKSELFRRELIKRCRLIRGFMAYEEFKNYYLNKKKIS